jgi:dUTP pyrophosphatase
MKIKIKRFDKTLPLPAKQTAGAAAFDLAAREEVVIAPGTVGYVPLNIAVETPPGHFLLVAARSSTHKKGLMMGNGIGIIDPDFSGDEDEVKAVCYNFTAAPVVVEKGFRIAQGIFIPAPSFEWDEIDELPNKNRGGFGTTGNK